MYQWVKLTKGHVYKMFDVVAYGIQDWKATK